MRLQDAVRRGRRSAEWKSSGKPIIRIQNLNNPEAPFNYYEGELPEKFAVRNGDLLFAWSGTPGTSFGAHVWHGEDAWLNQHIFKVLFSAAQFDKQFLRYAINQNLDEYIRAAHGGAGLAHITKGRFEASVLPVPSLAEQRRVVAEIERQFTRLDAGVAGLERVRANLKRYRAAVLKAACEGTLVPTEADLARAEGRDYETGDQVLERILTTRRENWTGKGKYKTPTPPDAAGLPPLPEGWTWATPDQVCEVVASGSTPSADKMARGDGEIPFIKVYNLTFGSPVDFSVKPTFIPRLIHAGTLARSKAIPGDVLMNIVGPPLGKVSIVPADFPEWNINQAVVVFRPTTATINKFLAAIFRSPPFLRRLERTAKATAGQFNVQVTTCRGIPIPLPPLAEQHRIVAEVERRLSVIDELDTLVETNLARAGRLHQSILAKAFSGELVPEEAC